MYENTIIADLTESVARQLRETLDSRFPHDFFVVKDNKNKWFINATFQWDDSSDYLVLKNYCLGYIDSLVDNK